MQEMGVPAIFIDQAYSNSLLYFEVSRVAEKLEQTASSDVQPTNSRDNGLQYTESMVNEPSKFLGQVYFDLSESLKDMAY